VGTGVYQGAEFVTARAKDYAQGKPESIPTIHLSCSPQLMVAFSQVQELEV